MADIFSLCERDKPEEVAALLKEDPDLVDETDSVSCFRLICYVSKLTNHIFSGSSKSLLSCHLQFELT